MADSGQTALFDSDAGDDGVVAVNGRCQVRTCDDQRVVLVAGFVIAQYTVGDRAAEANARVSLVEQNWADQCEVARAFGCSTRTIRRDQRRLEAGGLAALGHRRGYPSGRARTGSNRARLVARLRSDGVPMREIARRIGVSEKAVRNQLRRLGFRPARAEQMEFPVAAPGADPKLSASAALTVAAAPPTGAPGADPKVSASAAPAVAAAPATAAPGADAALSASVAPPAAAAPPTAAPGADPKLSASVAPPVAAAPAATPEWPSRPDDDDEPLVDSLDEDPADRTLDRVLAAFGLLDDAEPLFRDGQHVPRAGVLCAIPVLLDTGVLSAARTVYGNIGPAFYGLRTTIVTLLLMALLRIKRPEELKEHSPPDLGRILGLDRAPEVKTLRRKLSRLAVAGRAVEFGRLLARHRVETYGRALGFLYVDGHVRVYHGERAIPKAHVARMRLALPATTDYWVNDRLGDPLFVVTAKANAGLVKMLPEILQESRLLVGDRRLTVVFDRGGWSPRLFQSILEAGFDFLTYRKGRIRNIPRRLFNRLSAVVDGERATYVLADRRVRLRGCKRLLRQVTRLSDITGHQTHIITSRMDLSAVEVAFRMFGRWRQENFFKYMREEYALDALVDYDVELDDPTREVPNPKRAALDAELRAARQQLDALKQEVGVDSLRAALTRRRRDRAVDPAFAAPLAKAITRVMQLEQRRAAVPVRIPVAQREPGAVIKLATEKKHLTSVLKMVGYQAESELVRLITPHYRRAADEARTLVQAALASAADLRVTDTELRVTLAPQSSPHRTAAVAALCKHLDERAAIFPGTRQRLRLRFAVAGA